MYSQRRVLLASDPPLSTGDTNRTDSSSHLEHNNARSIWFAAGNSLQVQSF